MTTSDETPEDGPDPEAEEAEQLMGFALRTPFGVFTDVQDLPPEIRQELLGLSESRELPDELRQILALILKTDRPGATPQAVADDPAAAPVDEALERQRLWRMLDEAFPHDPHLWQAVEALFRLSETGHVASNDHLRLEAIRTAQLHLAHLLDAGAGSSDPAETLITKFRRQLGEI